MVNAMDKITTSRYTFFVNSNDKFYLYNSLSNALIEVDNELYVLLEKLKKNHSFYTPSTDTESLFIDLKKDYFVTYNDEDDFLIAIYIFSLCLYEPDIDYKQLTMQFKESLMKGYENEY